MIQTETNKPKMNEAPDSQSRAVQDKIDACFADIPEHHPDNRSGHQIEGLKEIPELVKNSEFKKALGILEELKRKYLDFDFIYAWEAQILQKQDKIDTAREVLLLGLERSRSKDLLLSRLGLLEFETGRIEKAVPCWIKSALLMSGRGEARWEPFFYLARTAKGCGLEKHAGLLMKKVAQILPETSVHLKQDTETYFIRQIESLEENWIPGAIDRVCRIIFRSDETEPVTAQAKKSDGSAPDPVWKKRLFQAVIAGGILVFTLFLLFKSDPEPETTFKDDKPVPPPMTVQAPPEPEKKPIDPAPSAPSAAPAPAVKKKTSEADDLSGLSDVPDDTPAPIIEKKTDERKEVLSAPETPHKARLPHLKSKLKQPDAGLIKKKATLKKTGEDKD